MSIRPPSDIVLDVVRAADPTQYAEASRRLTRSSSVDALAFDAVLDRAAGSRPRHLADGSGELAVRKTNAALLSGGAAARRTDDVYSRFEAMALTTFVETMLPASSESVFGSGTSGNIWKSMLAEKIAAQMAAAGGVGIADQMRSAAELRAGSTSGQPITATMDLQAGASLVPGAPELSLDIDQYSGDLS